MSYFPRSLAMAVVGLAVSEVVIDYNTPTNKYAVLIEPHTLVQAVIPAVETPFTGGSTAVLNIGDGTWSGQQNAPTIAVTSSNGFIKNADLTKTAAAGTLANSSQIANTYQAGKYYPAGGSCLVFDWTQNATDTAGSLRIFVLSRSSLASNDKTDI